MLINSIVMVDRKARTKKGIVCQIDTQFKMTSYDEDLLKKKLQHEWGTGEISSELLSKIEIDVKSLVPYFCEVDELGEKVFERVKKREMTN